jgi:hypothetical protein
MSNYLGQHLLDIHLLIALFLILYRYGYSYYLLELKYLLSFVIKYSSKTFDTD